MQAEALTARHIAHSFGINMIYARRLFHAVGEESTLSEVEELINEKPKPFVKWVGGKRQLLRQFRDLKLYPPDEFDPTVNTYFEPFVGGGAVFFDLLPKNAELSDLNHELVVAYKTIKCSVDELIESLKTHIYDKDYYLEVRAQDPKELPDIDVASRFIFLNRTGFNGMYRVNKKGEFNVPFGRYENPLICDEQNLRRVSTALQKVWIEERGYDAVLDRTKKGDFVYFDPPYHPVSATSSFTSYTSSDFTEEDQTELRDLYLKLHEKGVYVMLSNSDTPLINDLYSKQNGIRVHKVSAGRSINSKADGRGKITEVVVTNY